MSFPAMSLGLRFCASREGGTGGGGWVSALGWDITWLLLDLAVEGAGLAMGGLFLSTFA